MFTGGGGGADEGDEEQEPNLGVAGEALERAVLTNRTSDTASSKGFMEEGDDDEKAGLSGGG